MHNIWINLLLDCETDIFPMDTISHSPSFPHVKRLRKGTFRKRENQKYFVASY